MIGEFLSALTLAGVFVYFAARAQRRKEEAAERQFHMLMQALDEKAKREGTFVASYSDFDKK